MGKIMISNNITKIIISLLLSLLLLGIVTEAATTTYSGVTNTYSGGVTTTNSGVTTTYSGSPSGSGGGVVGMGENVTDSVQATIPVATLTKEVSPTESGKVSATPAKKASGFEVVFAVITIFAAGIKLKRR